MSSKPDGRLRQCCRADNYILDENGDVNINITPADVAWNLPYMKQLRLDLMNNKKPSSCSLCWEDEDKYHRGSRRHSENELWSRRINFDELVSQTRADGHLDVKPIYWDLRLGNLCNLKCIMCSAENSSLWMKDNHFSQYFNNHANNKPKENFLWGQNPNLWKLLELQLENIQEFYFSGGEPLLSTEHLQLLKLAVNREVSQKINLRYDTNGLLVTEKHFQLWSQFKTVYINLSIDGIGKTVEYIRYPTRWAHLEKVFEKFENASTENIKINPQFSLSSLNPLGYLDFIDWKMKKKFKRIGTSDITSDEVGEAHVVDKPEYLSLRALLPKQKKFVREEYKKFIENIQKYREFVKSEKSLVRLQKKLIDFLTYMDEEDWSSLHYSTLELYLGHLDQKRGTSYKEVAPWLSHP